MLDLAFRTVLFATLCAVLAACDGGGGSPSDDDDDVQGGAGRDAAMGPAAGRGPAAGSSGRFDLDGGVRDGSDGDEDSGSDGEDAGSVSCTSAADCDDDDACTEDTCRRNMCVNAAIDPDDDDACTTDTCDRETGVQHEPVAVADTDPCTVDSCDPESGVAHVFCPSGLCDGSACVDPVTTAFEETPALALPTGPGTVTHTITVSDAGSYLWDLNVRTSIAHLYGDELDVTLRSPAGTIVTLTTDNGFDLSNVFNGTLWDDAANPSGAVPYSANPGLATSHPYLNGTAATPLVPEEPLGAFIGEDPNGTWTLTIHDDTTGDAGTLTSWGLDVTTLAAAPAITMETLTQSTAVAIPDNGTAVTSTITVPAIAEAAKLCSLTVTTNITHTFPGDLSIALTSPGGRIATLSWGNGGGSDNVFAGTLWTDDASPAGQVPYETTDGLVTDHPYMHLMLASPLAPEEALSSFIGESVAGTWTLTVADDVDGDEGTLHSWSLNLGRCMRAP